jgi:ATP-dependent helicase/DNAse subunit B
MLRRTLIEVPHLLARGEPCGRSDGVAVARVVLLERIVVRVAQPDRAAAALAEQAVADAQTRNGMILGEDAVYAATNSRYMPVRLKTDGTPYATSADKVYTREGWGDLCLKLKNVVESIADRMKSGDVSARPLVEKGRKSPCEYCEFRPICRNPKL